MLHYIIVQCAQYKHKPCQAIMKTIERGCHFVCITHLAIKREKGANCFTNEPLQVFWQTNTKKNWKNGKMYNVCHAIFPILYTNLTLAYECFVNLDCGVV